MAIFAGKIKGMKNCLIFSINTFVHVIRTKLQDLHIFMCIYYETSKPALFYFIN